MVSSHVARDSSVQADSKDVSTAKKCYFTYKNDTHTISLDELVDGKAANELEFFYSFPSSVIAVKSGSSLIAVLAKYYELLNKESSNASLSGCELFYMGQLEKHHFNRREKAENYLDKAVQLRYPLALLTKADDLFLGDGALSSQRKAIAYYEAVIHQSDNHKYLKYAHLKLAFHFRYTDENYEKSVYHYNQAGLRGCASSQHYLATSFAYGKNGFSKDIREAVIWFRMVAEQNETNYNVIRDLSALFENYSPSGESTILSYLSSFVSVPVPVVSDSFILRQISFGLANYSSSLPGSLAARLRVTLEKLAKEQPLLFAREVVSSWKKVQAFLEPSTVAMIGKIIEEEKKDLSPIVSGVAGIKQLPEEKKEQKCDDESASSDKSVSLVEVLSRNSSPNVSPQSALTKTIAYEAKSFAPVPWSIL